MYYMSADSLTAGPCLPQEWKRVLLVTQHTLPHKPAGYTQHAITNSTDTQNTCTEHKWYELAITTSGSNLSMSGRRGKGKIDMNPVNYEEHIHLVIKEEHCNSEWLHRRLSPPVAMSKLFYICIHLLLKYTQNVGLPYACPNIQKGSFLVKLLCC